MELDFLRLLEEKLESLFSLEIFSKGRLVEAARYALLGGGKRIRPLLVLASASLYDVPLSHILVPACALEILHTYSLVHDDLPCMDNDDERRGKPSLHKAYPESMALLTGDLFLTYSLELLATAPHLSLSTKLQLITTLTQRAGVVGMIGGQEGDLFPPPTPTWLDIEEIHRKKTGALFSCALEFGGILGGEKDLSSLQKIGYSLGLGFQLQDDLLDIDQNDPLSAITCLGKEETQKKAKFFFQEALATIRDLPCRSSLLENLAHKLAHPKNLIL